MKIDNIIEYQNSNFDGLVDFMDEHDFCRIRLVRKGDGFEIVHPSDFMIYEAAPFEIRYVIRSRIVNVPAPSVIMFRRVGSPLKK
jgi:hypothetical protein